MEKAYTMAEEPYTRIYARLTYGCDCAKNMESDARRIFRQSRKMIGVVKTDGYGHGAVRVAKTIAPFVWGYAVATLEEGQNLRRHGIDKPILVLGSTHPRHFAELIEGDIRPAIFEEDKAESCSQNLRFRWGKHGENAYCAQCRHGTNRISPG
ncbi:MAG: alanine racemase [Clostridium fessum]